MEKSEMLYKEREQYRKHIKELWKKCAPFSNDDKEILKKLDAVHKTITVLELNEGVKPKHRIMYSVCGWSEKHGYFRSKNFKSESLREAKEEFNLLKKDKGWRVPTLIVEETYFRKSSPAMVDFDGEEIGGLGFSNFQELIKKDMMGNKQYEWSDLIKEGDERYTY